jgi:hypothetical protein
MSSELCPVCFAEMKEDIAYVDYGGPTCEHYLTCPNLCYDYMYAYGTTVVTVMVRGHRITFGWSYHEEDTRGERDALEIATKAAQRAQLEDYWVLVKKYGENNSGRSEEPSQPDLDNGLALQ